MAAPRKKRLKVDRRAGSQASRTLSGPGRVEPSGRPVRFFHPLIPPLLLCGSVLAGGCSSKDERAAQAAAEATAALTAGDLWTARQAATRAVGIRDDVSEYWLLSGRIALAGGDLGGAFAAYQNVINLDRSNQEALNALCRLALVARDPDQVDRYADQLLLLTPGASVPLVAKGAAALQRGDDEEASKFVTQVLANDPNYFDALMLKGRIELVQRKFAQAAATVESTLGQAGDPRARLQLLREVYGRSGDRTGYERTMGRLAQAQPEDPLAQLAYADLLFETGRGTEARTLVARAARMKPGDETAAATVLNVLGRQGADAMSPAQLRDAARGLPPATRAAFARYAIDLGRVGLARDLATDPGTSPDARAVAALAQGLAGERDAALATLNAVLTDDPANPQALFARARLQAAAGERDAALADARRVVADDAGNVPARLLTAELLTARGDRILAVDQLREGVNAAPGEARLARALAGMLNAAGRPDAAGDALRDAVRAAPLDLRLRRLRDGFCAGHRAACAA